ncbi:unnamed protein product, partial [Closterium sp. Naga37s-1]
MVIVGSPAKPGVVSFRFDQCGTSDVWGPKVDALVLWRMFEDCAVCNVLQLFASEGCGGEPVWNVTAPPYVLYQTVKMQGVACEVLPLRCLQHVQLGHVPGKLQVREGEGWILWGGVRVRQGLPSCIRWLPAQASELPL